MHNVVALLALMEPRKSGILANPYRRKGPNTMTDTMAELNDGINVSVIESTGVGK